MPDEARYAKWMDAFWYNWLSCKFSVGGSVVKTHWSDKHPKHSSFEDRNWILPEYGFQRKKWQSSRAWFLLQYMHWMVGPPRELSSVAGGLVQSTCAKKLTFLDLEVLLPVADALGPGTSFELSEILLKARLVMMLTLRFTNATKSLNSTGLAWSSMTSSLVRRHLSLKLYGSLKTNFWMFPGWSKLEMYWLLARAFLQLVRKIENRFKAAPSSSHMSDQFKALVS